MWYAPVLQLARAILKHTAHESLVKTGDACGSAIGRANLKHITKAQVHP
jgi:hypothetical protein